MVLFRLQMALVAQRGGGFLHIRRMTVMTAGAGNVPVPHSRRGDVIHPVGMTINTFVKFILSFSLSMRSA